MTLRYMLDTDTFIYIRQKRPLQVEQRFERLMADEAAMSVITYGELVFGAEKSSNRSVNLRALAELIRHIAVLPMSEMVAETYGAVRAVLERAGEVIGNNDLWIAAHAKAAGLTLVTNNVREFKRVPGLKVENWTA